MRFVIKHEIKGRLRIHIIQGGMSFRQADMMEYYLSNCKCVTSVKVNERLQDAVVCYVGNREEMIEDTASFLLSESGCARDFFTEFRQGAEPDLLGQAGK